MRARQHAGTHGDRPYGPRIPAIDACLAVEDLAPDDLRLEVEQQVLEVARVWRILTYGKPLQCAFADLLEPRVASLFLFKLERLAQVMLRKLGHLRDQRILGRRWSPVPRRLAGLVGKLVDGA